MPWVNPVGTGMSCPVSGPSCSQRRRAVVAQHSRVDRHDESVVDAHPRHLQQHVPAEQAPLRGIRCSCQDLLEQPGGIGGVEVGGEQLLHPVVGGHGAVPDEVLAPFLERGEVAGEGGRLAGGREECGDPIGERRRIRVEVLVGPERRKDPGLDVRDGAGRHDGRDRRADRPWWRARRSGIAPAARAAGRRAARACGRSRRRSRRRCPGRAGRRCRTPRRAPPRSSTPTPFPRTGASALRPCARSRAGQPRRLRDRRMTGRHPRHAAAG